jgi:hypothetical protein
VGVENIHGLTAEQSAQSQSGGDKVAVAKKLGDDGESGLPGTLIQLSPWVNRQDQSMSPARHNFRLGKNSPFLASPT